MKIIFTIEIPDAALEKEGVVASEVLANFESEAAEMREDMPEGSSITLKLEPS